MLNELKVLTNKKDISYPIADRDLLGAKNRRRTKSQLAVPYFAIVIIPLGMNHGSSSGETDVKIVMSK